MPLFFFLVFLLGIIFPNYAQMLSKQESLKNIPNALILNKNIKPQSKTMAMVSCSGKSGSTTLQSSFNAIGIETYRFHVLIDTMYDYILESEKDTAILLIDSMRDIISRKVASYFQHLTTSLEMSQSEVLAAYKKDRGDLFKKIQRQINSKILKIAHFHAFRDWKKFNYDCLKDGNFDFKKKYQLKKIGNLYFVNLRFDDIENWQEIIQSLDIPINFKNFKIVSANKSEDKWYRTIYKDFLTYFTISKSDFNTIISDFSEEISHFYTEKEIEKFIEKWQSHFVD